MAKGFKMGGGGSANLLNCKVVGNPKPENPRENTIWVNTDVPIGAWYFSATQPENMAEGEVWIATGTSSPVEFNALKKNGLQVYPMSAKQYIGGALVDVTAKIYQSGEWCDFALIIFDGTTVADGYSFARVDTNGAVSGSVVFGDGYVEMETAIKSGALVVQQPIDVTDKTTLEAVVKWSNVGSSTAWRRVALKTSLTNGTTGQNHAASAKVTTANIETVKLDVSTLEGKYYFLAAQYNEGDATAKARIYSLRVY